MTDFSPSTVKVGSGGGYKWSNFLHHAGWNINEDVVRKAFPLTEAEIIINDGKDGIDVFITLFFNPKRRWIFYPQALYNYNLDNIGNPDVKYTHKNQVPRYNIYETVFKDNKWQKVGKIGYCLPKVSSNGSNYLFIPPNFRDENARKKYYRLSRQKVKKIYKHMNNGDFLITRRYFVFDVDDDYIIQDNARLMYDN